MASKPCWPSLVLLLCASSGLAAQETSPPTIATLALGIGVATHADGALLGPGGFEATLRLGRRLNQRFGVMAEYSHQYVGTYSGPVPAATCAPNADCAPPAVGSATVSALGIALRGTAPLGSTTFAVSVTPGWSWVSSSLSPAKQSAPSAAVAGSLAFGSVVGSLRNLLEVRYQRSFRSNLLVDSEIQVGLGVSWR